jgi:hypothetical protein
VIKTYKKRGFFLIGIALMILCLPLLPAAAKGDFDGDGDVDFDDFVEFAGAYGTSEGDPAYNLNADFDGDNDVDFDDFVEFAGVYGTSGMDEGVQMADEFGVGDATGDPNTYVEVPVNITNTAYAIMGIQFNIGYDSTVINLTDIKFGVLTSTGWGKELGGTPGANVIVLDTDPYNATGIVQSGSVVLLNFSVKNAPGRSSPMNITDTKLGDTSLPLQKGTAPAKNGTFTCK